MPPWTRLRRHPVRTAIAVGACLLLAGGAYLLVHQARARDRWRAAEQAVAGHDFARAQDYLAAYLEYQPDSAEAHFLLARVCRRARAEDFDRADHHLAEARRLGWPEDALAVEGRLLEFQRRGTGEKVLVGLLENPAADRRLVLEALVRGCLRATRMEDAAAWLDRWVEAFPDDDHAYLWRGTLSQHMDESARAVADFERVLQLNPAADVRLRLGLALVQGGNDYARARRLLEDYRQQHPDDADTRVGIARCRAVLDDPAGARALLQEVLAGNPDHTGALQALAVLEMDRDDSAAALALLRRLEPLASNPPTDEAFARLLRLEPVADGRSVPNRRQAVYHLLARVLRQLGEESAARDYDERVRQLDADVTDLKAASRELARTPNDVNLWYRLGTLNLRVGMTANGLYWLERIVDVNPNDARAHRALADHYRGRPDPQSRKKADWHQARAGGP
jgi:tetratricopeptide (TPR) repeat protein